MDEPLTNLDAELRADMRAEVKHVQQRLNTTMIYVTHDQTEAMALGHRIAILNKGKLEQLGAPMEVYDRPATLFAARFIGSPPMNLIEAEVTNGHLTRRGRAEDRRAGGPPARPEGDRGRPARAASRVAAGPDPTARAGASSPARRSATRRSTSSRPRPGCSTSACPRPPASPRSRRCPCATRRGAARVRPADRAGGRADDLRDRRRAASRSRSATSRRSTHLELDVPEGAFFVLLGPSGAGKTTTLRVIAGLEKPDTGTVHLTGIDATKATPAERDLAMVFQSYALYPKQTAAENIASPLRARKLPKSEIDAQVKRVSELLHIEELLERKPTQMSGGADAARRARARAGARPARVPDGRAADQPRPQAARRDAHRAHPHPPLAGADVPVRHQRPGRGHVDGRPGRRAARGNGPAGRLADGDLRPPGEPLGGHVRRLAAHEPAQVHGQRAARGRRVVAAEPGFGIQGDRPALFGVRSEDLSLEVREESAALDGQGLRRRAAGRPHAGRRRDRRSAGDHQGAADGVVQDRRARSAPRSTSTASTCSTPTRSRRSHEHDRRPATAGAQAGADPRACPARRRRVARGARVRARRLAGHRAPRPRAALGRGAPGARARRRALAAGHAAADRDGLERARARGGAREGLDRACGRASWSRTGRRSSSTRPRPGWRWRGRWSCGRRPS